MDYSEMEESSTQFTRGLAAERANDDAVGVHRTFTDPASHPQGQNPGLARAGPRDYTQDRIVGRNRVALCASESGRKLERRGTVIFTR
jgi:hypothetical protein